MAKLFTDGKFSSTSWYEITNATDPAAGSLELGFSLSSEDESSLRENWESFLDHQALNNKDEDPDEDSDYEDLSGDMQKISVTGGDGFEFDSASQVLGLVHLEIIKATDLPRMANMAKTSFDMDPFVVISFGKKTFRTPHIRHNLNPVFNEKLMFPVLQHEMLYSINFAILDKDKFTLNDDVASVDFEVSDVLKSAPVPDPNTKLYDLEALGYKTPFARESSVSSEASKPQVSTPNLAGVKGLMALNDEKMASFELPLKLTDVKFEGKYHPKLYIKARFIPYGALRQQFWRGLIKTFDTDESGTMNFYEISELLEALGATLSEKSVLAYFSRFGKHYEDDDLTIDELVICLEEQVLKDTASSKDEPQNENEGPLQGGSLEFIVGLDDNVPSERVIQISACPFCNQPRLDNRSELDIVTHLATCASQDWGEGGLTVEKFVTSSEARQRWYTKAVTKVTYGHYELGANSANILVQDRITGFIQEEKMSVYVRLGIRLLYKGLRSEKNMESKRARAMLKSQSIKQGLKYDNPISAKGIQAFIDFHHLNMNEVLEPLENFKTFNEFFFRKLKPSARPVEAPEEERIVVAAADSRSTYFPSISKATEIWIKGREFSIARLFGTAYPEHANKFIDGSLNIFRLAPQDYHRFHVPVSGIIGEPKTIAGEYYTVNPMAIRSTLDVYGENVRVLVPIQSDEFGLVMIVCVGAMMVGSTVITAKAGDRVKRGDELGYFKFGGSTLVVLFEPGRVKFDADLVENSSQALETLVRVGMAVGHAPSVPEYKRHDVVEKKDIERAKLAIAGGEQ